MPRPATMVPIDELPAPEPYQSQTVRLHAWHCPACDLWAPYTHGGVFNPPVCGACGGPLEMERRP